MAKDINKIPKDKAKIKGHLTQIRKNTSLTTTNKNIWYPHKNTDPSQELHNDKT